MLRCALQTQLVLGSTTLPLQPGPGAGRLGARFRLVLLPNFSAKPSKSILDRSMYESIELPSAAGGDQESHSLCSGWVCATNTERLPQFSEPRATLFTKTLQRRVAWLIRTPAANTATRCRKLLALRRTAPACRLPTCSTVQLPLRTTGRATARTIHRQSAAALTLPRATSPVRAS